MVLALYQDGLEFIKKKAGDNITEQGSHIPAPANIRTKQIHPFVCGFIVKRRRQLGQLMLVVFLYLVLALYQDGLEFRDNLAIASWEEISGD